MNDSTTEPSSSSPLQVQQSTDTFEKYEDILLDGYEEDDEDTDTDDDRMSRRNRSDRRQYHQPHPDLSIDASAMRRLQTDRNERNNGERFPAMTNPRQIDVDQKTAGGLPISRDSTTLIQVDTRGIFFDNVVWSKTCRVLHRFHVTNVSSSPVQVLLDHSFEDKSIVSFQRSNENLLGVGDKDKSDNDSNSSSSSSNSRERRGSGSGSGRRASIESSRRRHRSSSITPTFDNGTRNMNQLLNNIGLISKLHLRPKETTKLILGFLPKMAEPMNAISTKVQPTSTPKSTRSEHSDAVKPIRIMSSSTPVSQILDTQHAHRNTFFAVKGMTYLQATIVNNTKPQSCDLSDIENATSTDQIIQIPIRANLCRSGLETDCKDLDFGLCVPGQKYVKDITVWNRSEIPLYFTVSSQQHTAGDVEFMAYESGNAILGTQMVSGYSHMVISVNFIPAEFGDIEFPIFVENNADQTNSVTIHARANIASINQDRSFDISDENGTPVSILDFGNCFASNSNNDGVYRVLTFQNTGTKPLDITLSSDAAQYVSFGILPDTLDGYDDWKRGIAKVTGKESGSALVSTGHALGRSSNFSKQPSPSSAMQKYNFHGSEEFFVPSGEQRKIAVWYARDEQMHEDSGIITKLHKSQFRLFVRCRDDKDPIRKILFSKTISCFVRYCTSIIDATPRNINFGDSSIGSVKYATVTVENKSDLPTRIAVRFISKVITCNTSEAIIQPHQKMDIKFKLSARKVNPNYRKQITIINFNNPDNDCIIEMQSNNIDSNMLIFHSMFYDVHTSSQHNFAKSIEFKTSIVNDPSLRSFLVKNITDKPIKLTITTSSPKELQIFKQGPIHAYNTAIKNQVLTPICDQEEFVARAEGKYSRNTQQRRLSKKFFATTAIDKTMSNTPSSIKPVYESQHRSSLDEGIKSTDAKQFDQHLTTLTNMFHALHDDSLFDMRSDIFSMFKMELRKNLELIIEHGLLRNCSVLNLAPREELTIYVLLKPLSRIRSSLSGSSKKIEERIFINLLEYDEDAVRSKSALEQMGRPDLKNIPPRELFVQANMCRSVMGITQKFINFGSILNTEEKTKTITVSNLSEISLLYRITKTGSIASGDLQFDDDISLVGQIRPYGSNDFHLTFKPSIAGKFLETITIENLQDPEDTKVITIKAYIEMPEKFLLKAVEIDFGEVMLDRRSPVRKLVLVNNTKRRRIYEIREDMSSCPHCKFEFDYGLEEVSALAETEKLEAELEKRMHKLRISIRKNKVDKIKKLTERVEEINRLLGIGMNNADDDGDDDQDSLASSDDDFSKRKEDFVLTEHGIRFSVPSNATQIINIAFKPSIRQFNPRAVLDLLNRRIHKGSLLVYESKNNDSQKIVTLNFAVKANEDNILKYGTVTTNAVEKGEGTSKSVTIDPNDARIELNVSEIDLGRVSVGEAITFTLVVRNASHAVQSGFVILTTPSPSTLDSSPFDQYTDQSNDDRTVKLQFNSMNAILDPGQEHSVVVTCTPQNIGPQRHVITLQNLLTKQLLKFTIYCHPQRPPPIYFPQLIGKKQELNIGYSFVDKSKPFANIFEFFLQNKKPEQLVFDVTTNAPGQVFIFQDVDHIISAENVLLGPKCRKVVYVCLKPYLSQSQEDTGHCRVLAAGLHVKILPPDRSLILYERTIPFKSVVGHSILKCSVDSIDFGGTDRTSTEFYGRFTLSNTNLYLPLEYELVLPENGCISLVDKESSHSEPSAPPTGRIVGQKIDGPSEHDISFMLRTHRYGLNDAQIKIRNKMNEEQSLIVDVRAFVDSGSVETDLTQSHPGIDVLNMSSVHVYTKQGSYPNNRQLNIVMTPINDHNIKLATDTNAPHSILKIPETIKWTHIPSMHMFTLYNKTDKELTFTTKSDIDVVILPVESIDAEHHSMQNLVKTIQETTCDTRFKLSPHQQQKLLLVLRGLPELKDNQLSMIQDKKQAVFTGTVYFSQLREDEEATVIRMVQLNVHTFISEGILDTPSVYIGKFGHISGWRNCHFEFKIRNTSDVPLVVSAEAEFEDEFQIEMTEHQSEEAEEQPVHSPLFLQSRPSNNSMITVDPLQTKVVRARLIASAFQKYAPGLLQRNIRLVNQNNPTNNMTLVLVGKLTTRVWKITNLDEENHAILPMLELPSRPLAPSCDKIFSIINTSEEDIHSVFEIYTDPQVTTLLNVELLDFSSSAKLKEYKFEPSSSLDIRIRCTAKPHAYIPQHLWDSISSKQGHGATSLIRMGQVKMRSSGQPAEIINIYGSLVQNPTFSSSIKRLLLPDTAISMTNIDDRIASALSSSPSQVITYQQSFTLKNAKADSSLHFKIESFTPENAQFSLTTVPVQGFVEPDGSILISVFLDIAMLGHRETRDYDLSQNGVHLQITDIYAPLVKKIIPVMNMGAAQLSDELMVSVPSAIMFTTRPEESTVISSHTEHVQASKTGQLTSTLLSHVAYGSIEQPLLTLKGCTPISNDNGSSTRSNRYEIHIGQQNLNSSEPVEWDLIIQNNNPTPISYRFHTIEKIEWLSLSQLHGTISSQHDTHHITLSFTTDDLRAYSTYLILENCTNPSDVKIIRVQMEAVLSGAQHGRQLFAVHVDGLSDDSGVPTLDLREVFFGSMVRHRYIDVVNLSDFPLEFRLTSEPGSAKEKHSHSELHFSLSPTSLKSFHTLRVDKRGTCRVYVLYKPHRPKQIKQPLSTAPALVDEIDLYIKCRLVKDYQQVVKLRAKCIPPRMKISTSDLLFIADRKTMVEPSSVNITIQNLCKEPLHYRVRDDYCVFFEITAPRKCHIAGRSSHTITVKPLLPQLLQPEAMQQKYIEEHFTIYNRYNLKEKWWVTMRFTRGYLKQFYTAPGPKSAFTFNSLEDNIVRLLSEFNALTAASSGTNLTEQREIIHRSISISSIDDMNPVTTSEFKGDESSVRTDDGYHDDSSGDSSSGENTPQWHVEAHRLIAMFRKQPFTKLYFDLHYITDELVFYGLKDKSVGQSFFDLAQLLYSALLEHDVFRVLFSYEQELLAEEQRKEQADDNDNNSNNSSSTGDVHRHSLATVRSITKKWAGQLSYYLSFFPDQSQKSLPSLRHLHQKILFRHGV